MLSASGSVQACAIDIKYDNGMSDSGDISDDCSAVAWKSSQWAPLDWTEAVLQRTNGCVDSDLDFERGPQSLSKLRLQEVPRGVYFQRMIYRTALWSIQCETFMLIGKHISC